MFQPGKKILCACASLASLEAVAQQKETATATTSTQSDLPAIMMVIIALVLAFVIWGMGQVLVTLGRQVIDKQKAEKVLFFLLIAGLPLLSADVQAQEVGSTISAAPANYAGMSSTAFWMLVTIIAMEFIIIAYLMFFIRRIQSELIPEEKKTSAFDFQKTWKKWDKKFFTRAVSVEKEADVMLDHNYDGIRELDNALPPWWKYGFIVTVVIGIAYLLNFHVLGIGKNPTEEYLAELEMAKKAKEAYEAKNKDKVDENNLVMPLADGIAAGKSIYQNVCWACHGKEGEGGAGPNLTDEYWIHKGSLSDIFQSIKTGYPDKGMQSWEKNYTPKEILNIAGYIKSLKGTNPANAKAAQGDLFIEPTADSATSANPPLTDSASLIKP